MSEFTKLIYDIICAYYVENQRVYDTSIITVLRGPKPNKKAPVAEKFRDYYFYGIFEEVDPFRVRLATKELTQKGIITSTCNEILRKDYYNPVDIKDVHHNVQYMKENKQKLIDEF